MCLVFFCDDYLGCMESMKCGISVTLIPSVKMHVQGLRIPMVVKVRLTGIQRTSTDERATGKRNLGIDLTVMATT